MSSSSSTSSTSSSSSHFESHGSSNEDQGGGHYSENNGQYVGSGSSTNEATSGGKKKGNININNHKYIHNHINLKFIQLVRIVEDHIVDHMVVVCFMDIIINHHSLVIVRRKILYRNHFC